MTKTCSRRLNYPINLSKLVALSRPSSILLPLSPVKGSPPPNNNTPFSSIENLFTFACFPLFPSSSINGSGNSIEFWFFLCLPFGMTNRFRKLPEIVLSFSSRFLRCLFHPKAKKRRKVENKCMFKNYFRKTVCFLINDRCVIDAYARFIWSFKKSRKANCDLGLWKKRHVAFPEYFITAI